MLNVNRSHLLLSGGKHIPTASTNYTSGAAHPPPAGITGNVASLKGWNFKTLTTPNTRAGSTRTYYDIADQYFFDLPGSQSGAFDAVCTLVWNRQNGQVTINNLDLFLYNAATNALVSSSVSGVDNVEHLSVENLPAGRYVLQVFKPAVDRVTDAETYALAFDFSAVPPHLPPTSLVVTPTSSPEATSVRVSPTLSKWAAILSAGQKMSRFSKIQPPG